MVSDVPALIGVFVILFVIFVAGWTYVVIRTLRARQAAFGQKRIKARTPMAPPVEAAADPIEDSNFKPWSSKDDAQLTRLLRYAARGE
jgi:hypothetical protein